MRVVHDELKLPGYCFGEGAASDARITALEGDRLRLQLFGEAVSARVPGGGAHRALTLAACLLAAKLLDVDVMAATELPHDLVPAGRGNIRNKTGIEIVDDSYNANPASMQAALTALVGAAMGDACRWLGLDEKNALAQGRWLAHYESVSQHWLHGLALALSAGDRVLVKGSNRIFWHVDFVEQLIEHIPA
jgi:UDP-N-acetylmuramoyl-tripeptide--D-alanyl-D-alanine ligase